MRFHGCCRKGRSKIKINDGFNGACSTIEHAICLLLDFWFLYTKNGKKAVFMETSTKPRRAALLWTETAMGV